MNTLPHYVRDGLRLIWAGYNPSIFSAEAGHYYARPGNAFWRQLSASGLVRRPTGPADDALLMDEAGIGFTDLCDRPTSRALELTPEEVRAGAQRLRDELERFQPLAAAFNGRGVYRFFARFGLELPIQSIAGCRYGEQPCRLGCTRLWVVPSSSGLASKWHRERLELLHVLSLELANRQVDAPTY